MIGILPAAGEAKRMHGIPKYLLPEKNGYLLKRHMDMLLPVVNNGVFIGTNGLHYEWIAQNAPDAQIIDVGYTATMSETVLGLQRYAGTQNVLFGMPDTYIEDENLYADLTKSLRWISGAIATLVVFETRPGQHMQGGMVEINADGFVISIEDKPTSTKAKYIWGAMAWHPEFWEYILPSDPHVGFAAQRAIEDKKIIQTIIYQGGYWDCGTPERYFALIRHLTEER